MQIVKSNKRLYGFSGLYLFNESLPGVTTFIELNLTHVVW